MGTSRGSIDLWNRVPHVMLGLCGLVLLCACAAVETPLAPAATAVTPPAPSLTATATPARSPTPARTATPPASPTPSQTPFARSLDAYGLVYDPNATPSLPFRRSVSMPVWDNSLPATPVEGRPVFARHPAPAGLSPVDPSLLAQAGCAISSWYSVECAAGSPLAQFGCSEVVYPEGVYFAPQPGLSLVAGCWVQTDDWEPPGEDGLHLFGCAFRRKVSYLFTGGDGYLRASSTGDLRERFAPIESPAEAISFAQLATGLQAMYNLAYQPELLYLKATIEDTRAVEDESGYRVNLYHHPGCFCEPYIYSEVTLRIARDGSITWLSAAPYALTTGFSCAD